VKKRVMYVIYIIIYIYVCIYNQIVIYIYIYIYMISESRGRQKTDKIRSMTEKVIRNLRRKNGDFFLKNVIRKFVHPPKKNSRPGLRPCLQAYIGFQTRVLTCPWLPEVSSLVMA